MFGAGMEKKRLGGCWQQCRVNFPWRSSASIAAFIYSFLSIVGGGGKEEAWLPSWLTPQFFLLPLSFLHPRGAISVAAHPTKAAAVA